MHQAFEPNELSSQILHFKAPSGIEWSDFSWSEFESMPLLLAPASLMSCTVFYVQNHFKLFVSSELKDQEQVYHDCLFAGG